MKDGKNRCVFHVLRNKTTVFYVTSSFVILWLHTSLQLRQHGKNVQNLLLKTATNDLFVRLLVVQNDKAKKRYYDSGQKNCLRKGAVDGKVIFIRKELGDHALVYSKHFCGSKFILINISMCISLLLPK